MNINKNNLDVKCNEKYQNENRKNYESPNLIVIGKIQKVTLKTGSVFDVITGVTDLPST